LNHPTPHATVAHRFSGIPELTNLPPFDDADLFDEAGYLRLYPGIAEAMMRGMVGTAWDHYFHHGRVEGRQPNDIDTDFYLAAYPEIERDLGHPPSVSDAARHFITLGRGRGYLPNPNVPRATNGAALASPFGGFWTDQGNALDLIQGRLDLGRITRRQAAMLRTFVLEGIAAFDRSFEADQERDAALVVAQAFTGLFPDLMFAPMDPEAKPEPWRPELTERPVAALDPHMVSGKIRALLLDKTVTDFLSLLFDAPPKLTASRADLRLGVAPERDVALFPHTLPLQFVAVTFALENSEDGPSFVWPGSHRLPDIRWPGEDLSLTEARRANARGLERAAAGREDRVRALVHGQEPRRIGSSSGTRMVRHANLIHWIVAPEPAVQRRSLAAWYCPAYVAPCYQETARANIHVQNGIAFSSGVYPTLDPLD
jgi:hypothetical protein